MKYVRTNPRFGQTMINQDSHTPGKPNNRTNHRPGQIKSKINTRPGHSRTNP